MESTRASEVMRSLCLLSWKTLLVGWDRRWITKADLITFAIERLQSGASDEDLTAVASLASSEDCDDGAVRRFLAQLAGEEPTVDGRDLEKWRLARLIELDEMDLEWDLKVTRLEELGAEFGYPPDMSLCTRYGPSQQAIDAGLTSATDLTIDPLVTIQHVIAGLKQRLNR